MNGPDVFSFSFVYVWDKKSCPEIGDYRGKIISGIEGWIINLHRKNGRMGIQMGDKWLLYTV